MEIIALILVALVLAGGFTAFEMNQRRSGFTDKDKDGAPDEPDGPAKDL